MCRALLLCALAVISSAAKPPVFAFLRGYSSNQLDNYEQFFTAVAEFSAAEFTKTSNPTNNTHNLVVIGEANKLGCTDSDSWQNVTDAIVVVERGNCSFVDKAELAQAKGAYAIVVINSEDSLFEMGGDWDTRPKIFAVMAASSDREKIHSYANKPCSLHSPPQSRGYGSLVGLWVMACGCVICGSLWGAPRSNTQDSATTPITQQVQPIAEEQTVEITAVAAMGFIVFASLALVLLFFLMKYLVIVIIAMFCIGSISAVHMCLYTFLVSFTTVGRHRKLVDVFDVRFLGPCNVLSLVVLCISVGISVWFFVARHERYSWVLQDIMGVCLCLLFLKTFHFPNIKVCSILLCLAFFYDIFWVFISPKFFRGESVMVKVATGGGTGENIPMLLRFPNACEACSDSMLGLGDVVLPGLLVAFSLAFDRMKRLSYVGGYFVPNVVGYGIGLILTYVALFVMQKGQPALLYLVPCTLGTTLLLGAIRGHLRELWSGPQQRCDDDVSLGDQAKDPAEALIA